MPDAFESLRHVDAPVEPSPAYRARLHSELSALSSEPVKGQTTTGEVRSHDAELEGVVMSMSQSGTVAGRRWRRSAAAIALAAAVVAALVVVAARRSTEDRVDVVDTPITSATIGPSTSTPVTTGSPATTASPAWPGTSDPAAAGAVSFAGPQFTISLAAIDGVLWAVPEAGAPLQRLALNDGARMEPIAVPPSPSNTTLAAVGFGSLWIARLEENEVYRVDTATGSVTGPIDVPGDIPSVIAPAAAPIATDASGVYVIAWTGNGAAAELVRIDPDTNAVSGTVPLPAAATNITADAGSLWLTTQQDVVKIDPTDGRALASIPVATAHGLDSLQTVRVGAGAVWLHGRKGDTDTVVRINPESNTVTAVIPVGRSAPASSLKADIVFAGDAVWTCTGDAALVRIDPRTNEVLARYLEATGGCALVATEESVWFTAFAAKTLYRLAL